MFASVRGARREKRAGTGIDLAPLIDMVFILLIFFMVTTTFVTDLGLEIDRPTAASATTVDARSLRISVTRSGSIFVEGERIAEESVRGRVRTFVREEPSGAVIVVPDAKVTADVLVRVLDLAKLGGARELAVAAREAAR